MANNITETLIIDVLDEPCNPVYIVWKNTIGGWSYWMFEFNQQETFSTRKGDVFESKVFDLETAEGTFETIANFPEKRIVVGVDGITKSDWEAISEINFSPKIYQMFKLNDALGNPINRLPDGSPKKIALLSASTTSETRSKNNKHRIQLELEYPKIFVQTQL